MKLEIQKLFNAESAEIAEKDLRYFFSMRSALQACKILFFGKVF